MKINEILKQTKSAEAMLTKENIFYITGAIQGEPDGKSFRYYQNPEDLRSFLVINSEDVVGEVHPLSESERVQKGFFAENVFRFGIKFGTKVQSVYASTEVLGETISAEMTNAPEAAGRCKNTSGCSSHCCTYGRDGKCYCDTCCIG